MGGLDWRYVMTGSNLPNLRQGYMELVGHPLVPPKKMFGLWVSEFGYHNWTDVNNKMAGLINSNFPLDGFVLDSGLVWRRGGGLYNSMMGNLAWDTLNFPGPAAQLAAYKADYGVGIMNIEESYVSRGRPEWTELNSRGYLEREGCANCAPVYFSPATGDNTWWGRGGMIDWDEHYRCGLLA